MLVSLRWRLRLVITRLEQPCSPVHDGGALAGQSGAENNVSHRLQLGLQQDPLVLLVELRRDEVRHLVRQDLSTAALSGTVEVADGSLCYPDTEVAGHAVPAVDVLAAQELNTLAANLVSQADITAVQRNIELLISLHLIELTQESDNFLMFGLISLGFSPRCLLTI